MKLELSKKLDLLLTKPKKSSVLSFLEESTWVYLVLKIVFLEESKALTTDKHSPTKPDRPVIARTGKRAPLTHEVSFLTPVTKARGRKGSYVKNLFWACPQELVSLLRPQQLLREKQEGIREQAHSDSLPKKRRHFLAKKPFWQTKELLLSKRSKGSA